MTVIGFVVAAAVASVLRWGATERLGRPTGTMAVNFVGSFLLGVLFGAEHSPVVLQLAALGSLTTFSTLMVSVADRAATQRGAAAIELATALVGCVGLAWLGLHVGRS